MQYETVLILRVDADSLEDAVQQSVEVAAGLGTEGLDISAITKYEQDKHGRRLDLMFDDSEV